MNLSPSFFFLTLNSEEKYHFSIWYKHLAAAHWSKIFKYLILSQIIVLLGKLNVSVRDSFTHFCSWLYSIQRSHQGTASTAKWARWGRLSITCQSLSTSIKAGLQAFLPLCVSCPTRNSKKKLKIYRMDFRNRIEENPTSRYYTEETTHSGGHQMNQISPSLKTCIHYTIKLMDTQCHGLLNKGKSERTQNLETRWDIRKKKKHT